MHERILKLVKVYFFLFYRFLPSIIVTFIFEVTVCGLSKKMDFEYQIITKICVKGQKNSFKSENVSRFSDDSCSRNSKATNFLMVNSQTPKLIQQLLISGVP